MITRKQYPNHHVYETEIGGRAFTVETGKVAELADAECICRYGDTVVLTTVTCNPIPKAGIDYFPLTIEFEERMYSVGRIPGSFNRREGKPSERGILNSRIIDRPMRPLFDEELRNDTVVTCTVLANDYDNPVEIVASLGASIAIACSDVPWNGPVATTNVAHLNGKYIINPSSDERDAADCFVCISSTFEKVVMIETEAKEAPENIVYECIRVAHEANMEIVKFINSIVAEIGKPKFTFEKAAVNHELLDDLMAYGLGKIEYALDTPDKNVREERLTAAVSLKNVLFEHLYHKPSLDVEELYQQLMELREQIRHSDCDAFIGATAASETANDQGRTGMLDYYGKESIRDACIRAGERARKLHENRQSREITKAILNNSQFGMIVTDAEGRVKLFNQPAQRFTGIAASQIRGKLLTDFFPNLSIAALLKSGQNRSDSYRLVVGAMMRCVQERITHDRRTIGILITLYPESHNRKKAEQDTPSLAQIVCRWEDVIAVSPIMKKTVEQVQNLAKLHYPTMILRQPAYGREIFARCMHSTSPQAQKPYITNDQPNNAPQDAPHIHHGYKGPDGTVSGLLTSANGGSVILKNVALAKPVVHACLMQALTSRHIFRPGMTAPLLLDLMVYTIMTPEEARAIPPALQSCLAICQLELPPLTRRKEDIGPLFLRSLSSNAGYHHRVALSEQMEALLTFHNWPGQLQELQAVCTRYVIAMSRLEKATPKAQYLLLLQAIGDETIFREILAQHPALTQRPVVDKEAFLQGILQVKALMKYSNDTLAEKLSGSRTTIWRILQDTVQSGEDA